jgi:hypothetical protein
LSGPIDVKTESLGAEYVGYHMEISISILLESHGTFLKLSYGGSPICGDPSRRLRIRKALVFSQIAVTGETGEILREV